MNSAEFEQLRLWMNEGDRFAVRNNAAVLSIAEGTATAEMHADESFTNALQYVQGGALFTLADLALAAAANSYGFCAVTMCSSVNFIRPGKGKVFRAVATNVSHGRHTAVFNVDVSGQDGKIVLHFTGTSFLSETPLPFLNREK